MRTNAQTPSCTNLDNVITLFGVGFWFRCCCFASFVCVGVGGAGFLWRKADKLSKPSKQNTTLFSKKPVRKKQRVYVLLIFPGFCGSHLSCFWFPNHILNWLICKLHRTPTRNTHAHIHAHMHRGWRLWKDSFNSGLPPHHKAGIWPFLPQESTLP